MRVQHRIIFDLLIGWQTNGAFAAWMARIAALKTQYLDGASSCFRYWLCGSGRTAGLGGGISGLDWCFSTVGIRNRLDRAGLIQAAGIYLLPAFRQPRTDKRRTPDIMQAIQRCASGDEAASTRGVSRSGSCCATSRPTACPRRASCR